MEKRKLILKYYSLKMLLTIDLNMMIDILVHDFGDIFLFELQIMNEIEKAQVSTRECGILKVIERFRLIEESQSGSCFRRQDLEQRILNKGNK